MDTFGVRAIHPPPERGGFLRIWLKRLTLNRASKYQFVFGRHACREGIALTLKLL